jgi:hypothetical protein
MSKTYDAMMKLLDEKGSIPDDEAARLIKENGPLDEEERKKVAAAIKMAKALSKSDDKDKASKNVAEGKGEQPAGENKNEARDEKKDKPSGDDLTMDDYLRALSVLDSDEASKEDKERAQKVKDKFESQ